MTDKLRLSQCAQKRYGSGNVFSPLAASLLPFTIASFFGFHLFAAYKSEPFKEVVFLSTFFVIFSLFTILSIYYAFYNYRERKIIIVENARDYEKSLLLAERLKSYEEQVVSDYSIVEDVIKDALEPWEVQRFVGQSLVVDLASDASRNFGGYTTPQLLDESSVLFLKDVDGNPLRVLLPSARSAKCLLREVIIDWLGEVHLGTYTYGVLNNFFVRQEAFEGSISHPHLIDTIALSCTEDGPQKRKLQFLESLSKRVLFLLQLS